MKTIDCAGRLVGSDHPCFIIAEAGVNHQGDPERACHLIRAAAAAGADAVKFQTFSADRLASAEAPKAAYQRRDGQSSESQRDMLRRLELPLDAYPGLLDCCRDHGIVFLSSPFDEEAADFLASLDVPAFKLPSGELVNEGLLRHVAGFGKPVILSTGMASLGEVEQALTALEAASGVVLLHCVSLYPAPPETSNLRVMRTLRRCFDLPVGYSDHTLGIEIPVAAVALGACVVEKHLTLDAGMAGPDHAVSLEPAGFTDMVAAIRAVELALGDGRKRPAPAEVAIAAVVRKSLTAAQTISKGAVVEASMLALRRPGDGLPPSMRACVVGRRAARDIPKGCKLDLEMLV